MTAHWISTGRSERTAILLTICCGLPALLVAAAAQAAPDESRCGVSPTTIRAATVTDVVVCHTGQPDKASVRVAAPAELIYSQPLGQCGVNDKRPGLHLALTADDAGTTDLMVSASNGQPVCSTTLTIAAAGKQKDPDWLDSMPPEAAKFIDVDGIRTRYFEQGTGQPVLLVHGGQAGGANNSAEKWEQNFPGLAEHYRVIAIDRLAQAGTANLSAASDYADYFAQDAVHLQRFISALDLQDAILVGHSQGGWPVTRAALDMPERVSCLVNVDTVMVPDDMTLMGDALKFLLYTSRHLHPSGGPTVHSARRGMALRYPTGNNITDAKAQRVVDQYNDPKTVAAREHMNALRMTPLHESFRMLKAEAHNDIQAGKLQARSVVIWGELDPQVPLGLGQQFNAMLQDAATDTRLVVIAGTGHAPFIEQPEEFNQLIRASCAD